MLVISVFFLFSALPFFLHCFFALIFIFWNMKVLFALPVVSSFQTNYKVLKSAMSSGHLTIDHEYMPFGRLSKETIEKARDVLKEIK